MRYDVRFVRSRLRSFGQKEDFYLQDKFKIGKYQNFKIRKFKKIVIFIERIF